MLGKHLQSIAVQKQGQKVVEEDQKVQSGDNWKATNVDPIFYW